MSDLIFYATEEGRVFGPYGADELRARAFIIHSLQAKGHEVYAVNADTYEQARRRVQASKR